MEEEMDRDAQEYYESTLKYERKQRDIYEAALVKISEGVENPAYVAEAALRQLEQFS